MSNSSRLANLISSRRHREQSKLPIVELDRVIVQTPRKRLVRRLPVDFSAICTTKIGHVTEELRIRSWQFYHAAAKTEFAKSFSLFDVESNAAAYRILARTLLRWSPENLRLKKGGVFSRKDSSRSALAGRFAEAVLYLFMVDKGYAYWDHVPSLVERALDNAEIEHSEQLRIGRAIAARISDHGIPEKQPDFAFENFARQVALAEAKGSFVTPGKTPTGMKSELAHGLEQLAAWQDYIRPRPHKSFVVGTYLREASDPYADPSMIAFVDPEDDMPGSNDAVRFPDDWIRRGNYGSWLLAMGFDEAGDALRRNHVTETQPTSLLILEVGSQRYAVSFLNCECSLFWHWELHGPRYFLMRRGLVNDVHVLGIEVDRLRILETAINSKHVNLVELMDASRLGEPQGKTTDVPEWFSGSLMPDGTLLGSLHFDRRRPLDFEFEEFNL